MTPAHLGGQGSKGVPRATPPSDRESVIQSTYELLRVPHIAQTRSCLRF